ncbi:MAG TPA: phage tail tube protein [Acidothermaceae bacterium]|nr:phage tail tube protein [Acidothermaceae bacterium]
MAGGGGLFGAIGVVSETAYGSYLTPTRTIEIRSAKLQERVHIVQGTGLADGRTVDLGSRRNNVWTDGGGDIETEFLTTEMALLLANALGSNATLVALTGTTSAVTAYSATFNYGVPDNQNYFSLQALVPDTSGTLHAESYQGCKITKSEWTIERTGLLMCTYTVDAQQWNGTAGAFTPVESTSDAVFQAVAMTFEVGTYGSEAAVDGVRKCTFSIERELDVERIYLGSVNKDEPITKGMTKLKCTMDVDLLSTNKAALWDIYNTQAATSIIATLTGPQIGTSGNDNKVVFALTNAYVDQNGTPELDGPDVVKASLSFTGLIDAANNTPFSVTLTTPDSTY